jgi:hypothetical protein
MIDYDFIEIGTCCFDTLVQECDINAVGLSVEPIKYYLDKLPEKPNVKKVNCAISFDNTESDIDVYFIPESVLISNNLPIGLSGCNRIGEFHPHHISKKLTHLVSVEKVKQKTLLNFLKEYNVRKVKHLKLDTEGGDCFILNSLANYLQDRDRMFYPEKITFETNLLTEMSIIESTVNLFINLGYSIESRNNWYKDGNTILVLN